MSVVPSSVHFPLDLVGQMLLAEASCKTRPGRVREIVAMLTIQLINFALSNLAPTRSRRYTTRTGDSFPPTDHVGLLVPDVRRPVVVASVMRAGAYMGHPAEAYLHSLGFKNVRHHFPIADRIVRRGKSRYRVSMGKAGKGIIPKNAIVFICDPMIATGGTLATIASLYAGRIEKGGRPPIVLGLIGVKEGFDCLRKAVPELEIVVGRQDGRLDENLYIRDGGGGDMGEELTGVP